MTLAAPTTPAELLCLAALLPLMAGATWLCVQMARQARVDRRTQRDEDERRGRREDG